MNGLPRISLIGLPLKRSDVEINVTPMMKDIEIYYQHSADMYRAEFAEFLLARKHACEPTIDYTGLSKQKRYFSQLQLAKGRFHFSTSDNTAVYWDWCDAFTNEDTTSADILYEEASILYNIGALHSILGTREHRTDDDSLKVACTHFQCAAWIFDTIFDRYHLSDSSVVDLNAELIRVFGIIMMAQAQECIVEKSISDNRPANITAKLTQYLIGAYEQAVTQLNSSGVVSCFPSRFHKELLNHCRFKAVYYAALGAYFCGLNDENENKYGRSIAWYQLAQKRADEAEKQTKSLKNSDLSFPTSPGSALKSNAQFLTPILKNKLTSALKENDFIYHDSIPEPETLEEIKPACLVKGIPFDPNDQEIRGEDIFRRLVPMKTLEVTSVYSEKKATLLRELTSEVEKKDLALEQFLTGIDLDPDTMLSPDPSVPQELYDVCAQVSGLDEDVEERFQKKFKVLTDLSAKLDQELQALHDQCEETKVRVDALSTVKPSAEMQSVKVLVRALYDRLFALTEALKQAKQSNAQLADVYAAHAETLKLLCRPIDTILDELPSVKELITDTTATQAFNDSQRLFSKVDEMTRQRADLVKKLRDSLHADDATSDLLTADLPDAASVEALFTKRLQKHDALVGLIRQNLAAQDNVESALVEVNANFTPLAAQIRTMRKKRANELHRLISSGQAYLELFNKIDQGVKFYEQSQQRINEHHAELDKFRKRVDETEKTLTAPASFTPRVNAGPVPSTVNAPPSAFINRAPPTLGDYMSSMRMPARVPVDRWSPVRPMSSLQQPSQSFPPGQQPFTYAHRFPQPAMQMQPSQMRPPEPMLRPGAQAYSTPFGATQPGFAPPNPSEAPRLHHYSVAMQRPAVQPDSNRPPYILGPPQHGTFYPPGGQQGPAHTSMQPTASQHPMYPHPPIRSHNAQPPFRAMPLTGAFPPQPQQQQFGSMMYSQQQHHQQQPIYPGPPISSQPWPSSIPAPVQQPPPPTQTNRPTFPPFSQTPQMGMPPATYHPQAPAVNPPRTSLTTQPYAQVSRMPQAVWTPPQTSNTVVYTNSEPIVDNKPIPESNTNHVSGVSPVSTMECLQPQVLTKMDFETLRREEQLRASHGSQNNVSSKESGNVITSSLNVSTPVPSATSVTSSTSGSHSLSTSMESIPQDPLSDPLILNRFIAMAENLLTWIDKSGEPAPDAKQLPGKPSPNRLDVAWSAVQTKSTDYANAAFFKGKRPTHAAALCCPSKNRNQEFIPYDANRVVLQSSKNDYINASHIDLVESLGKWCPRYIVSQAPLPKTVADFWNMIFHQGCEVVVFLPPRSPPRCESPFGEFTPKSGEGRYGDPSDPLHVPVHLPLNKPGSRFDVPQSAIELRLQAIKDCGVDESSTDSKLALWTERILTIHNRDIQQTRSLVHLCYNAPVPSAGQEDCSSVNLCKFINHVHMYYRQQRSLVKPIAVVCEFGAGLSGIFVTASVGILHEDLLGRIPEIVDIAALVCQQRRHLIRHPFELLAAAKVIAQAAVETVAKRDIVIGPRRSPAKSSSVTECRETEKSSDVSSAGGDLLDSLFSAQSLDASALMSVINKWSVGDAAEGQVASNSGIDPNSASNDVTQATPASQPSTLPQTYSDHLTDLASLMTSTNPQTKRITRKDFDSLGPDTNTSGST